MLPIVPCLRIPSTARGESALGTEAHDAVAGMVMARAQPSFTAVPEALTISMLPSLPTTS